jgi:hypothetical protein
VKTSSAVVPGTRGIFTPVKKPKGVKELDIESLDDKVNVALESSE